MTALVCNSDIQKDIIKMVKIKSWRDRDSIVASQLTGDRILRYIYIDWEFPLQMTKKNISAIEIKVANEITYLLYKKGIE